MSQPSSVTDIAVRMLTIRELIDRDPSYAHLHQSRLNQLWIELQAAVGCWHCHGTQIVSKGGHPNDPADAEPCSHCTPTNKTKYN